MKITLLILVALPLLVLSIPLDSADNASTEDIDRSDVTRAKRSGFSLVSGLKNDDSHFDGWGLKKSILNTLFQAVKAITGGVTVLKGQLIKGSGYAVSGVGKVIAAGGDAVSNVGKKITTSAHLIPASHSVHPFAKLSGSLASGSAGLISGASSSSSGSLSSSGHHTGPSSESFTSYEAPHSYGHDSNSHVSAPSSAAYIPPKHSSHYKSPLTSYGTEVESDAYPTGPHYLQTPSKSNVVEASDVLRQILKQKVPQGTPTGYSYNSYHHQSTGPAKYEKKKVISQHDIPTDSYPPPFKPINSNNYLPPLYGVPHGAVDSVTHSQSITTSFGAPYNSQYVDEVESQYPQSYDIYRSMSVKMAGKKEKEIHPSHSNYPDPRSKKSQTSAHPSRYVSPYLSPPRPTALTTDQKHLQHLDDDEVHHQQIHDLSSKYGPSIEVQKSLAYEINDPVDVSHLAPSIHDLSRRSDDSSNPAKGDKSSTNSNGDNNLTTKT